jgi:endoglucanase
MKSVLLAALALSVKSVWGKIAAESCEGVFHEITAAEFVQNISPGWNLGNTLDAEPTEGSWNNPPVTLPTFQTVKDSGFKGVRIPGKLDALAIPSTETPLTSKIPVTWIYHFISGAPDYTVNATWLERVSTVVDMATSVGLYSIINVHHGEWNHFL